MEKRLTKTNQISLGQIAFVLMAILTIGKFFYLPGLMYNAAGADAWISGAILVAVNWLILFAIYHLIKKSGERNLGDLLSASFGKAAAKIILILLAAFYLLHFIMPVTEVYNYLNFVSMQKSTWVAFIIPLFALVWFMAHKGLTTIARNCELFAPFVFIAAAALFAFSLPAADIENVLPLGVGGAGNIFSGVLKFSGWFSDCAVFLMFIGKSKSAAAIVPAPEKHSRHAINKSISGAGLLLSSILTSALIIGFFILFPAVFGTAAGDQKFALARVTEFGTANFLGHGDRAAVTVWLFGSLLKMALFAYAAFTCFSQAIPLKNEKARGGALAGLLVAAAVLPILFKVDFVLKDLFRAVWFLIPAGLFAVVLPLYLLFIPRKPVAENIAPRPRKNPKRTDKKDNPPENKQEAR